MSTLNGGPGNIVTNGLVLYLDAANYLSYTSGSTTWRDLTSSNLSGSLINGPTFNSGNAGSIVFDGVNDYVDCGNPILLNISSSLTLESWVYPTAFTNPNGVVGILSRWGVGSRSYKIAILTASKQFYIDVSGTGNNDNYFLSNIILNTNTWYHVVGTYNGSSLSTYINGNITTGTLIGTVPSSLYTGSSQIRVGDDGGNYFLGNIAASRIYNRALSSSEVLQNYNAQKTRFGLT